MTDTERDLGPQPIAEIMAKLDVTAHDLVEAVPGMTHKRVARACKGRRLTKRSQQKVCLALNQATKQSYRPKDLFTYTGRSRGESKTN